MNHSKGMDQISKYLAHWAEIWNTSIRYSVRDQWQHSNVIVTFPIQLMQSSCSWHHRMNQPFKCWIMTRNIINSTLPAWTLALPYFSMKQPAVTHSINASMIISSDSGWNFPCFSYPQSLSIKELEINHGNSQSMQNTGIPTHKSITETGDKFCQFASLDMPHKLISFLLFLTHISRESYLIHIPITWRGSQTSPRTLEWLLWEYED